MFDNYMMIRELHERPSKSNFTTEIMQMKTLDATL
jgi:hypothetical protein